MISHVTVIGSEGAPKKMIFLKDCVCVCVIKRGEKREQRLHYPKNGYEINFIV